MPHYLWRLFSTEGCDVYGIREKDFCAAISQPVQCRDCLFLLRLNGLTMLSSKVADHFCLSVYVVAFLETKRRNLTAASSLSLLRALDMDRGMVHDTQLNTAHRAIRSCSYRSYASGESTSSAILRKCSNLFARSSISFVTGSSIRSSSTSYSFSLLRTTWFDRF